MSNLGRLISRRIATSVITLIGLASLVFVMTKLIPGDEARVVAGPAATPEQVAAVRKSLGLDSSGIVQYLHYMDRLFHGSLGVSSQTHQPVLSDIGNALPATIQLVIIAMIIALILAVPPGVIAARRHGQAFDSTSSTLIIILAALPGFWLGLLMQWVFGDILRILPVSGSLSLNITIPARTNMTMLDAALAGSPAGLWDAFNHVILPSIVLALPIAAQLFRAMRAESLRVLKRGHITVARAKGISERRVLYRHVLPNSSGPVLTLTGVNFGLLVAATVIVEEIFGIHGLGSYIFEAVANKDINAILGSVLVVGVFVIVANFIVEMIDIARDPRLRASELVADA